MTPYKREIEVYLAFVVQVESDDKNLDIKKVGSEVCRVMPDIPQIGNPDWIATVTGVGFIEAREALVA